MGYIVKGTNKAWGIMNKIFGECFYYYLADKIFNDCHCCEYVSATRVKVSHLCKVTTFPRFFNMSKHMLNATKPFQRKRKAFSFTQKNHYKN